MRWSIPSLGISLLTALTLTACGGAAPAASPAPATATTQPAPATPVPAPTTASTGATGAEKPREQPTKPTAPAATAQPSSPGGSGITSVVSKLSEVRKLATAKDVKSYRFHMSMQGDGKDASGEKHAMTMEILMEEVRDPRASHYKFRAQVEESDPEEPSDMEIYVVDGTSYLKAGNMWMKTSADAAKDMNQPMLLEPEDLLANVSDAKPLGTETINGRPAVHYHLDKATLLAGDLGKANAEELAGMKDAEMDVWVDTQTGVLSKFTMKWIGKQDFSGTEVDGTYTMNGEVKDLNGNFTITLPPEAKNAY